MNLASHFDLKNLLKFSASSVLMMFVLALYTAIDGLFISNYISNGIGALNIIMPIITGTLALSFMFSTGSNSIISKLMGEKKQYAANQLLTAVYIIATIIGFVIFLICFLFKKQIIYFLGANETLYPLANSYLQVIMFFIPFLFLQDFGQVFFITASKPNLSLFFTICGGIANALLDYVFVARLNLGMSGAAFATGIGYLFPAIASIIFLSKKRIDNLCFVKPQFNLKLILFSIYNGSSEFLSNLSSTIITILINFSMLSIASVEGVDAISVVLQIQFLLASLFIGYSIGVLPIISYKFGEHNYQQLLDVVRKSLKIILIASIIIVILGLIFNKNLLKMYLGETNTSYSLATHGFLLFIWLFLFVGANFFISMMFTGISDAKHSILISMFRSLIFPFILIIILPKIFGINGIWLTMPLSEAITFIVGIYYYKKYFIDKFKDLNEKEK